MSEKHVHHWYINNENIGRCACGEIRDFGKLLRHESKLLGLRSTDGGKKGKRGRKKKEEL